MNKKKSTTNSKSLVYLKSVYGTYFIKTKIKNLYAFKTDEDLLKLLNQ